MSFTVIKLDAGTVLASITEQIKAAAQDIRFTPTQNERTDNKTAIHCLGYDLIALDRDGRVIGN